MIRSITKEDLAKIKNVNSGAVEDNSITNPLTPTSTSSVENSLPPSSNIEDFTPLLQAQEVYKPLEFDTPKDFLLFFDDVFSSGYRELHDWQKDSLELIGNGYTVKEPLEYLVCAANGSGKDAYVICPSVLWLCACRIRSRCVVTSASYTQLSNQTQNYVGSFAARINRRLMDLGIVSHDYKAFHIKRDHIVCSLTGSEIIMFATDEPGRAEGYHPFPDYPNGELMVVINEAKTVEKPIFEALSRCTFNRWLEISTPGAPAGPFYEHWVKARDYKLGPKKGQRLGRRVTSFDCSHISKEKIERDKEDMGEQSPLFRSKHLALFTSIDETIVFPPELVDKWIENYKRLDEKIRDIKLGYTTVGIDIAAGGDENSMYAFDGNVKLFEDHWTEVDTVITAKRIVKNLEHIKSTWGLLPENVNADDGGIGRAVIDMIRSMGWEICRVLNQSAAFDTTQYGNTGAEKYFNLKKLMEEGYVWLDEIKDAKLIAQFKSRYYRQTEGSGKLFLESKAQARAKGRRSPDRADAYVLSRAKHRVYEFAEKKTGITKKIQSSATILTQSTAIKEKLQAEKFNQYWARRLGKLEEDNIETTATAHPANLLRHIYGSNR